MLMTEFRSFWISTHTLTWSVTQSFREVINPVSISTHTLTWSVTLYCKIIGIDPADFNSHAHVERDCSLQSCAFLLGISTHTLTWSVTVFCYDILVRGCDFNSHAHVERDFVVTHNFTPTSLFQLTRSRGA